MNYNNINRVEVEWKLTSVHWSSVRYISVNLEITDCQELKLKYCILSKYSFSNM